MYRIAGFWLVLVSGGAVVSGPVQAQAPDGQLPPELLACAEETDVGRRLECFDREMAKLQPEPASVAPPATAAEAAVSTAAASTAATTSTATESRPAETPSAADSASDDFGLAKPEPEQISAVVTDMTHRPYGEFVVLLDNGQIWEQKHRDNRFRIDVGDQVTISEGLVSGFRLSAGGRNNSVQVERLK